MGMAASQARYLALLARKSNCEYEGQQINQSRLALSNQSADLFNQMMALQVPSTPNKSDFTVQKYTFTDGANEYVLDKWNKLSDADGDGYNYTVTYHYDSESYKGFQKYKLNPQVQFSGTPPTPSLDPEEQVRKIQAALTDSEALKAAMDLAYATYETQKQQAGKLSTYKDNSTITHVSSCTSPEDKTSYTVVCNPTGTAEKTYQYNLYSTLSEEDQENIRTYISKLIEYGALEGNVENFDYTSVYYYKNADYKTDSVAFKSDLEALIGEGELISTTLPIYHVTYDAPEGANYVSMKQMDTVVQEALSAYQLAKADYEASEDIYSSYDVPTKIGNIKIKPLATLDKNQLSAIEQIIADMKEEEIETNIVKCFDTMQDEYTAETYKGGLYTFEMVGSTYYTTYYDLYNSVVNGTGINYIDDQAKLPYYGAEDLEEPIVEKSRALIDRDKSGRFISIKLENDSLVYDLTSTSVTDEDAYNDAMNDYDYQKALYDKSVADINAKTAIIQKQDQALEIRLKQLDTEQSALNTEIDAVSKVVKDNIEKSFKTFGG